MLKSSAMLHLRDTLHHFINGYAAVNFALLTCNDCLQGAAQLLSASQRFLLVL